MRPLAPEHVGERPLIVSRRLRSDHRAVAGAARAESPRTDLQLYSGRGVHGKSPPPSATAGGELYPVATSSGVPPGVPPKYYQPSEVDALLAWSNRPPTSCFSKRTSPPPTRCTLGCGGRLGKGCGRHCQGRSKTRPRWRSKTRPRWRRETRPSGSGSKFLTAAWRGETSGSRSGRVLAGFLAVFEARAVAVQLEDVDVMGQPVEQRASQPFGAEDLGPFVEGQIRGHERRCLLVALGEDLEQPI